MNSYFQSYIKSLNQENRLEVFEDATTCSQKTTEITIVDLKSWNRLSSETQGDWLVRLQANNSYLVLLTDPKESGQVLKLAKDHENLKIYFLHLPIYLEQLANILESRPEFKKEAKPIRIEEAKGSSVNKKPRILVAEDNPTNQFVIVNMLQQLGFEYEVAKDGREAFEKFKHQKDSYDLILMDCQMPEMNGYEATREIRHVEKESDSIKKTPIVALTANAFRETKEECFSCGMDDFATKPIKFAVLKEIIEKVLSKYLN